MGASLIARTRGRCGGFLDSSDSVWKWMEAVCVDAMAQVRDRLSHKLTLAPFDLEACLAETTQDLVQHLEMFFFRTPGYEDIVQVDHNTIDSLEKAFNDSLNMPGTDEMKPGVTIQSTVGVDHDFFLGLLQLHLHD